jgi:hypothetical protein
LSTANGTAKEPQDYTSLTDLIVTFAPDQAKICVNVTITNDTIVEKNEMFYVIMTTNNPAVTLNESRKNLTITITNDDTGQLQLVRHLLKKIRSTNQIFVCCNKSHVCYEKKIIFVKQFV